MPAFYRRICLLLLLLVTSQSFPSALRAQALGEPDRGLPGDPAIQDYLAKRAVKLDALFLTDAASSLSADQEQKLREQFLDMLGLELDAPGTPLNPTVTGEIDGGDYLIEKVHFQSRPHLYVTGNLYRPKNLPPNGKLPAVLFVCGHSGMGRNGNKTAFQSHGIWLAKHGYICLTIDTLQLGEIAGKHHGTYNLERWWWHSRGYTPAGVECWNGIRAIDYLQSRTEVEPERIAVTGISGGGAATIWIAAADRRVKVAIPVSGMADLESYVGNRVINGHCDCMFLYNHYQWPWTRILTLIAPRPMLFVNSDQDPIFPMDANERISNRMERVYSRYQASDRFETVVSVGGHDYREDIRRSTFQFLNAHLLGSSSPIDDAIKGIQFGNNGWEIPAHPPESLRVFPTDADIPKDELNSTIDQFFVPLATSRPPKSKDLTSFKEWQKVTLESIKTRSFRDFHTPIELPVAVEGESEWQITTEPGIRIPVKSLAPKAPGNSTATSPQQIVLVVETDEQAALATDGWWLDQLTKGEEGYLMMPRGTGPTAWTRKNPPNYVERSHAILGTTVDVGRVRDIVSTIKWLKSRHADVPSFKLLARKNAAVLSTYAAIFAPEEVKAVELIDPPTSHMQPDSPQFLSILRTCDIPTALALLYPRKITLHSSDSEAWKVLADTYGSESEQLVIKQTAK